MTDTQDAAGKTWRLVPLPDNWWSFECPQQEIALCLYGGTPEQRKRYLDYLNAQQDAGAVGERWEWAGFDVFRYGKDTELIGGLEMANVANALEDRVQALSGS